MTLKAQIKRLTEKNETNIHEIEKLTRINLRKDLEIDRLHSGIAKRDKLIIKLDEKINSIYAKMAEEKVREQNERT